MLSIARRRGYAGAVRLSATRSIVFLYETEGPCLGKSTSTTLYDGASSHTRHRRRVLSRVPTPQIMAAGVRDNREFIHRQNYLALTSDDIAPYPTQSEPSWQTVIAYARKIGVIMGRIGYEERDSWEWIRDGLVRRKSVRTAPSKKRDYIQIQRVLADADQKSDAPMDYARQVHVRPRTRTQVRYMAHLLGVASLVLGEVSDPDL